MKNNFETLNIPPIHLETIEGHLRMAEKFVYADGGQTEAVEWLDSKMIAIAPEYSVAINVVIGLNPPNDDVLYLETGYDSCQSHRKLAKVVSELFLVGGLTYEAKLLGLNYSFGEVQDKIGSKLKVPEELHQTFLQIAQELGGCQDFIFPGVTKTDESTPSLDDMAWLTLIGKPVVSVRNITGVGGIRKDTDWNYSTDLPSYIKLKIEEDKRYYPGMGVFYWLANIPTDEIPTLKKLKDTSVFKKVVELKEAIAKTQISETEGLSILCSTFIPSWGEMKKWLWCQTEGKPVDLASAFHSPSYEFDFLGKLFSGTTLGGINTDLMVKQFDNLIKKLNYSWSFNSTIHIPWTSELDILSNNLMGKVTNMAGDYGMRYGIGYQGKSIEIREYHLGQERLYPSGVSGKTCYAVVYYPDSDIFEGSSQWDSFDPKGPVWDGLEKNGLINTMLKIIKTHE